jgi:hypothetical protein
MWGNSAAAFLFMMKSLSVFSLVLCMIFNTLERQVSYVVLQLCRVIKSEEGIAGMKSWRRFEGSKAELVLSSAG